MTDLPTNDLSKRADWQPFKAGTAPAQTEAMLDRITKNARPDLPADAPTPLDVARDEHNQLRADNLELVREFRVVLQERDVLQTTLEHEREAHQQDLERYAQLAHAATEQCHAATRQLTAIQTFLRSAGQQILAAVKIAEDAADDRPEAVKAFRPPANLFTPDQPDQADE